MKYTFLLIILCLIWQLYMASSLVMGFKIRSIFVERQIFYIFSDKLSIKKIKVEINKC